MNQKAQRAAHQSPPRRPPKSPADPARPLKIVGREIFCQEVARGVPVPRAYINAGYRGGGRERWQLRNSPEVVDRINFLLESRLKTDTARRHREEKIIGDVRLRLIRELERIAYSDIGRLVAWGHKVKEQPDGSLVISEESEVIDSDKLTAGDRAAVKAIRSKGGKLQIEMHDKLSALLSLAKVLGLTPDKEPAPPPAVTVNQVNVGQLSALDVARNVAFMLGALRQREELAARQAPTQVGKPINAAPITASEQ